MEDSLSEVPDNIWQCLFERPSDRAPAARTIEHDPDLGPNPW
jgi:hypothetical protein